MEILSIFLGSSQNWISSGVILCILGSFLKVNVQNGDIFGVSKFSNIIWGAKYF